MTRPRKPAGSRRDCKLYLRVTAAELAAITAAAADADLTITDYVLGRTLRGLRQGFSRRQITTTKGE